LALSQSVALVLHCVAWREKIAIALATGKVIDKVELVLPHFDEELWPQGAV